MNVILVTGTITCYQIVRLTAYSLHCPHFLQRRMIRYFTYNLSDNTDAI